jgi:hypothetical protein
MGRADTYHQGVSGAWLERLLDVAKRDSYLRRRWLAVAWRGLVSVAVGSWFGSLGSAAGQRRVTPRQRQSMRLVRFSPALTATRRSRIRAC